jgi:hypothetical protein
MQALRHLFTPAVTVRYPTVRRTLLRSLNRVLTVDLGREIEMHGVRLAICPALHHTIGAGSVDGTRLNS